MINFFVEIFIALYNILFHNLGLTIIVIAVGSRLLFWPLSRTSLQHNKKMQDIQPKLNELKKKHKDDRKRLSEEQMKLFKEHGINPAAGCLPLIVQIVVVLFLYQVVGGLLKHGLNTQFLFWNLANPDVFKVTGIPFAVPGALILVTALATLIQSKMMLPNPVPVNKEDKPKEAEQKQDFSQAMQNAQGQMLFLTPLLIAFAGTTLPAGLGLYWLVSTVLGIIQQYKVAGPGGLQSWLKKLNLMK